MEELSCGGGGSAEGGEEPQLRSIIIGRSIGSHPLLETSPASHCFVAGDRTGEKSPVVAYGHEEELMMAGQEMVLTAVVSHEKKRLPPRAAEHEHDEHGKGAAAVLGYVGRLLRHPDQGAEGTAGEKDGEGSSGTGAGQESGNDKEGKKGKKEKEKEKEKKKKKKRSSWLPDPKNRWPIQGFY